MGGLSLSQFEQPNATPFVAPNFLPNGLPAPDVIPDDYVAKEQWNRAKRERRKHAQLYQLNRAEMFDARLSRIYFTELSELPDKVKNYPVKCQNAFLLTFNNWLKKSGDFNKSMFAAWKALNRVRERLEREQRDSWKTKPLIDYGAMLPRKPQVVVA